MFLVRDFLGGGVGFLAPVLHNVLQVYDACCPDGLARHLRHSANDVTEAGVPEGPSGTKWSEAESGQEEQLVHRGESYYPFP